MTQKLSVRDLDLKGKRVLIRVDANVPIDKEGNITDDTRIKSFLPTVQYVTQSGGKAIVMSHLGRPKERSKEFSLAPCAKRLSELLHKPVTMASDCIGHEVETIVNNMKDGDVVFLENVRFYPAEEKPELDPSFAQNLAKLGDIYINDAFGACHRAHSSITTITKYFPKCSAAGFLLEKEIAFLGQLLAHPKKPFYAIIGGAKVSTKIDVLHSLIEKVDTLFIGGAMAYTFFKAQGKSIGNCLFEEAYVEHAKELIDLCKKRHVELLLPIDTVITSEITNNAPYKTVESIPDGYTGVDIGQKTIDLWTNKVQNAKTVLWNGPVGVFEIPNFAKGTFAIAKALSELQDATTIAGGGETIAAIQQADLATKFTHISTGGGASLEFIEKGTLPGIEVLTKSAKSVVL